MCVCVCVSRLLLTHYEDQHSSNDRASVFVALGLVAEVDAGHGHQDHAHGGKTQDRTRDHQGARGLGVGFTHTSKERKTNK